MNCLTLQSQVVCKTILHGDSGVGMLRHHSNFPDNICIGISKPGASSERLIQLIFEEAINANIENCIIHIGTNDSYQFINALLLKTALQSKYPNCKRYYVIWGTIGWGSVTNHTPCDQKKYYSKLTSYGFENIVTTGAGYDWNVCSPTSSSNYFSSSQSAHQINSNYNLIITKKLQQIK